MLYRLCYAMPTFGSEIFEHRNNKNQYFTPAHCQSKLAFLSADTINHNNTLYIHFSANAHVIQCHTVAAPRVKFLNRAVCLADIIVIYLCVLSPTARCKWPTASVLGSLINGGALLYLYWRRKAALCSLWVTCAHTHLSLRVFVSSVSGRSSMRRHCVRAPTQVCRPPLCPMCWTVTGFARAAQLERCRAAVGKSPPNDFHRIAAGNSRPVWQFRASGSQDSPHWELCGRCTCVSANGVNIVRRSYLDLN